MGKITPALPPDNGKRLDSLELFSVPWESGSWFYKRLPLYRKSHPNMFKLLAKNNNKKPPKLLRDFGKTEG